MKASKRDGKEKRAKSNGHENIELREQDTQTSEETEMRRRAEERCKRERREERVGEERRKNFKLNLG